MKYIKVLDKTGRYVLINVNLVTYFYQSGENSTTVCYGTDDYVSVDLPIEKFEEVISNALNADIYFVSKNTTYTKPKK